MPTVLISAGEVSGDLHGAHLVREMHKRASDLKFFGIGGNEMKNNGVELRYHIDRMGLVGLAEVVRQLPFVRRVLGQFRRLMEQRRPDLVILIDYPGFNLQLARVAARMSIPVLYYIAPQVWAWGAGRIKTIARYVEKVAVILPFEVDLYRQAGVDVEFVGHPLLESLDPVLMKEEFYRRYGLRNSGPLLGLLPGSRPAEIGRLLPVMLKAARIIRAEIGDLQVVVAAASAVDVHQIERTIGLHRAETVVIRGSTHEVMRYADLLLIASGTATLEAACYGTPSLILYKVGFITWLIGQRLVRVPHIGLVNIIAGKQIVPECIQFDATPARVASEALLLLRDQERREGMRSEMMKVRQQLGEEGASARTAQIALDLLRGTRAPSSLPRSGP